MQYTPKDWENPKWEDAERVHEWKNYVSAEVRGMWDTFTPEQKQALARSAEECASREEWD